MASSKKKRETCTQEGAGSDPVIKQYPECRVLPFIGTVRISQIRESGGILDPHAYDPLNPAKYPCTGAYDVSDASGRSVCEDTEEVSGRSLRLCGGGWGEVKSPDWWRDLCLDPPCMRRLGALAHGGIPKYVRVYQRKDDDGDHAFLVCYTGKRGCGMAFSYHVNTSSYCGWANGGQIGDGPYYGAYDTSMPGRGSAKESYLAFAPGINRKHPWGLGVRKLTSELPPLLLKLVLANYADVWDIFMGTVTEHCSGDTPANGYRHLSPGKYGLCEALV